MNPELQRIRIAEACGYKDVTTRITEETFKVITGFKNHNFDEEIPNYLNDLNAMHEAWQTLTSDQRITYRGELAKICAREAPERDTCWLEDIAAEFAPEAFLKTLGLWKEES